MESKLLSVDRSESVVAFGRHSSATGLAQNRYLSIDGIEAFDLGFPCDSCTMLFRRVSSAELAISPHAVSEALNAGLTGINEPLLNTLSSVVPVGDYLAVLTTIRPRLVRRGTPDDYFMHPQWRAMGYARSQHDPGTNYYRGRSDVLVRVNGISRDFFELVVPLYPLARCRGAAVEDWTARLSRGERPTCLSVAKAEGVSSYRTDDAHLVLTHVLLDGHHKMLAAARSQRELGMLALVNTETTELPGWSAEHLREVLQQVMD